MDNFRTIIERIDDNYFSIIRNYDSRVRLLVATFELYNIVFKNSPTNNNNSVENNKKLVQLLNIILIIFKKYACVYDFKTIKNLHIEDINTCIQSQKYKKNIANLLTDESNTINDNFLCNQTIDLVLSSGGNAGYYMLGSIDILKKMSVRIDRISAVSIGAWVGFFYFSELETSFEINAYIQILEDYCKRKEPICCFDYRYELWNTKIKHLIDENCYKKCNNRLFIGYTELNHNGAEFKVKSTYMSNDDVFLTCMASSAIPFLTLDGPCVIMDKKKVIDGALLKNYFFFTNNKNDQLLIDITKLNYPYDKLLLFVDKDIDKLIFQGAQHMIDFLKTRENNNLISIHKKNDS